mmetsp:Transcript_43743/g.86790  ORF Transcript_43743/g.86790 Transcript_43743/m.86790 type:complete len:256 (-) Transcript_43743:60-827(-)
MSGFVQHRHEIIGDTFLNLDEFCLTDESIEPPTAEVQAVPAQAAAAAASGQEVQRPLRRSRSFAYVAYDHKTVDTSFVEREAVARARRRLVASSITCATNTANEWMTPAQDVGGDRPGPNLIGGSSLSIPLWHETSFPMLWLSEISTSSTARSMSDVASSSSPASSPMGSVHMRSDTFRAPQATQQGLREATWQKQPRRKRHSGTAGSSDLAFATTTELRPKPNGVEAVREMSLTGAMILGRAAALVEDMHRRRC